MESGTNVNTISMVGFNWLLPKGKIHQLKRFAKVILSMFCVKNLLCGMSNGE